MSPTFYSILHVVCLFALAGLTFQAFANPDLSRKKNNLMFGGILSVVALVAGFGLISKLGYSFSSGWIWVKFACWLGLSSLSGMAYRKQEKAGGLVIPALVLIAVAVWSVYAKPF